MGWLARELGLLAIVEKGRGTGGMRGYSMGVQCQNDATRRLLRRVRANVFSSAIGFIVPRPILATIHTAALRHNLDRARRSALEARVWAVVKANAYGHRSEEHTSELQSQSNLVCRLLLEKKNKKTNNHTKTHK